MILCAVKAILNVCAWSILDLCSELTGDKPAPVRASRSLIVYSSELHAFVTGLAESQYLANVAVIGVQIVVASS